MARTKGSLNRDTKEFKARFEELSKIYDDPIEVLFILMSDPNEKSGIRAQCATTLIKYNYPVPKVEEKKQEQTAFTFTWDDKAKRTGDRVN
jgi:hypothetical protein